MGQTIYREYVVFRGSNISCSLASSLSIFRLRTGQCPLISHLHHMEISLTMQWLFMWNGSTRSRTHPAQLPYTCTGKNTSVATWGWPEGRAVRSKWGAANRRPVYQEHQRPVLSHDQGTVERRGRGKRLTQKEVTGVVPTGHSLVTIVWSRGKVHSTNGRGGDKPAT